MGVERADGASAIGVAPDGRASTVASASAIGKVPDGWIQDTDVVSTMVKALSAVIERMRERIRATDEPDPVSQDILISLTADLKKHAWMFQAESV